MSDLQKKIASGIAAGAMLLNLATPAFAGITLEISGNGGDAENEIDLEYENEVEVNQTNEAYVQNYVVVEADSGHNEAEDNVGGDVSITSGDATTNTTVSNTLNQNWAQAESCCLGDVTAEISGNGGPDGDGYHKDWHHSGWGDDNEIELELENEVEITQYNDADVYNTVYNEAKTGRNEAEGNVGGSVEVTSGDAESTVSVSTMANMNSAWVSGDGSGGSLEAIISGNGGDSENEIDLELEDEVEINQTNEAYVQNYVEAEAKSGKNEAEDNVGGDVGIHAGKATVDVTVDNMANFNWADVDGCGCLEDVLVKIHGNGGDSENEVKAEVEFETEADQLNNFDCKGEQADACAEVYAEATSGKNEAEDNVEGGDKDPTIESGDASAGVEVSNTANSNIFGDLPDGFEWPWEGLHLNLNFSFSLGDLLGLLE